MSPIENTSHSYDVYWLVLGFIAQFIFFLRFLVQWIATEIKKESHIPVSFWYFSMLGGAGLLGYSLYRQDPVFIVGNSLGLLVYSRNLYFIHRKK